GYFIQVAMKRRGKIITSFVRQVSSRARSIAIAHHPGGGRAEVTVWALNSDDKLGKHKTHTFQTRPTSRTLDAAAKLSVKSAYQSGGAVFVSTECPALNGHCQVRVELLLNGHVIVRRGFQQAPDSFETHRLLPSSPSVRRALRRALALKG